MNKIPGEMALPGLGDAPAPAARGPGRPAGSMNRRSKDWQRWWELSGNKHPLEFLAKVISSTPEQLRATYGSAMVLDDDGKDARLAGLGAKDVLALQIRAAEAALPYLEQKLPMAVEDVSEGKRMILIVGGMTPAQSDAAKERFGLRVRDVQNQGVIEVTATQSDGDQSDAQPNLLDVMENGR
jgi:hypothetical protein